MFSSHLRVSDLLVSPPSASVCHPQGIVLLATKRTFQKWVGMVPNIPDFLLQRDKNGNKLYLTTESCGDTGQDQKNSSLCCISEFDGLASQLSSLQMHLLSISQLRSSFFCFFFFVYLLRFCHIHLLHWCPLTRKNFKK